MINKIEIFLLVLSCVFLLKFVIEFLIQLKEENPKTITISNIERILFHLTISYIITYFLT